MLAEEHAEEQPGQCHQGFSTDCGVKDFGNGGHIRYELFYMAAKLNFKNIIPND
jgi:hypothetical protein